MHLASGSFTVSQVAVAGAGSEVVVSSKILPLPVPDVGGGVGAGQSPSFVQAELSDEHYFPSFLWSGSHIKF